MTRRRGAGWSARTPATTGAPIPNVPITYTPFLPAATFTGVHADGTLTVA